MSFSTCLSGGMRPGQLVHREDVLTGHAAVEDRRSLTDIAHMAPLIGVTTSEVRRGDLATLRRHGEPPQHEMALGLTYMRAVELAGGVPVVLPPLGNGAGHAARPPRRRLPVRRPRPRPRRLRRPRPRAARPDRARARPLRARARARRRRRRDAAASASAAERRRSTSPAAGRCTSTSRATARPSSRPSPCTPCGSPRARSPRACWAAARRRSTPSTTRRATSSATASSPPRGRRTARSRRSRTGAIRSCSGCSGTPRR